MPSKETEQTPTTTEAEKHQHSNPGDTGEYLLELQNELDDEEAVANLLSTMLLDEEKSDDDDDIDYNGTGGNSRNSRNSKVADQQEAEEHAAATEMIEVLRQIVSEASDTQQLQVDDNPFSIDDLPAWDVVLRVALASGLALKQSIVQLWTVFFSAMDDEVDGDPLDKMDLGDLAVDIREGFARVWSELVRTDSCIWSEDDQMQVLVQDEGGEGGGGAGEDDGRGGTAKSKSLLHLDRQILLEVLTSALGITSREKRSEERLAATATEAAAATLTSTPPPPPPRTTTTTTTTAATATTSSSMPVNETTWLVNEQVYVYSGESSWNVAQ